MQTFPNKSLKKYNTFGIDVNARSFIAVETVEELKAVLRKTYASEIFILGGGSNMLLTQDIEKTVVHLNLKGKRVVRETEDEVLVRAMAGENWHEFVLWCLEQDFGGIENLSLIPGNVGTAPIQNIGAYGVEIKDVFESCTALHVQTLELREFDLSECAFGYRESVFKNELKDQYIITGVTFRLTKKQHRLNTSYAPLEGYLQERGITEPGIRDVSRAVISIRESKLPNPRELGNSGSFFKNPVVQQTDFESLKEKFPNMPSYPVSETEVKVPAGWLIDQAGFKGYREGDAGVHKNQALVLVNYGSATGNDILALSDRIRRKVMEDYGIDLQPEVNIF